MSKTTAIIISDSRSTESARQSLQQELTASLADWPQVEVAAVGHLYDLSPDGPAMRYLQSCEGDVIVLAWLYPRAAYWMLDANRVRGRLGRSPLSADAEIDSATDDVPDRTIWCFDLREHREASPLLEEIRRIVAESTGEPVAAEDRADATAGGEKQIEASTQFRWYPVIDTGRCTNCLECLNFCLFGVFGLDESERLFIEQPDACRDGCPACARVCPSQAIIFPHHNSPAIAGDHRAPADQFDPDLVQLFGGSGPSQLAATERDRALAEKDELDGLVDDLDQMEL